MPFQRCQTQFEQRWLPPRSQSCKPDGHHCLVFSLFLIARSNYGPVDVLKSSSCPERNVKELIFLSVYFSQNHLQFFSSCPRSGGRCLGSFLDHSTNVVYAYFLLDFFFNELSSLQPGIFWQSLFEDETRLDSPQSSEISQDLAGSPAVNMRNHEIHKKTFSCTKEKSQKILLLGRKILLHASRQIESFIYALIQCLLYRDT